MQLAPLIFAAVSLAADAAHAQKAPVLLQKYDCYLCHADREARTGPAFVDVADKHRGKPQATATLIAVVRKSVHGSGLWPMPPLPQVPVADAKTVIAYILALKS